MIRLDYLATVLLTIWQRGPLLLEELHEIAPEPERMELVGALVMLRAGGLIHLNDGPVDPLYEAGMDEEAARRAYARFSGARSCKVCGCTDNWGCPEGCSWAGPELCSVCAEDEIDVGNATGPRNYNTERGIINRYLGCVGLEAQGPMTASSLVQGVRFPLPPGFDDGTSAFQHGPLRILITESEDHGEEGQWRHVSVSCESRLPTYEELGAVRSAYFPPDVTVLQVMPPESEWVNQHQYCLHLWQRLDRNLLPHGLHATVGVRGSLPNNALEVLLIRQGQELMAATHNLLRARGRVTVEDAQDVLAPLFKSATPRHLRRSLRLAFLNLVRIAPGVAQIDRTTFMYVTPQEAPQ